jgi:hypothetical protein
MTLDRPFALLWTRLSNCERLRGSNRYSSVSFSRLGFVRRVKDLIHSKGFKYTFAVFTVRHENVGPPTRGILRDVNSISDHKLRDMILFGLKCSREPQKLSEADYEKLR